MLPPTTELYEIILIVAAAWEKSFANVNTNNNAILEHEWVPYNWNPMTYPCLRVAMTNDETKKTV